jgi:predicted RNA polymerase sigma factor
MYPSSPRSWGCLALMLLQHSRMPARFDADGDAILLEDQDRTLWKRAADPGGAGADRQGDAPRAAGAYQIQAAIAACTRAPMHAGRNGLGRDRCAVRDAGAAAAVAGGDAQSRGGGVETKGPQAALDMIAPLAERLSGISTFTAHARRVPESNLAATKEAREAFNQAIALANTPRKRRTSVSIWIRCRAEKMSRFVGRAARFVLGSDKWRRKRHNVKHELVLELELDAPAEKLFRCYADPNLLQQWFAPKPWTIKSVDNRFPSRRAKQLS